MIGERRATSPDADCSRQPPTRGPASPRTRSLEAGHRGKLRRHFSHRGGQARAGHAVGGPRRHTAGRQRGRVRPRRRLRKLGGRQITLKFWIPEIAFGDGGVGLFESIETADTLELMGYLNPVKNGSGLENNGRRPA